ncbi:MAG: PadR family transcriptional regulator [Dehalococcoidia bacterium]
MRRKGDSQLVPLELSILAAGVDLRRGGTDEFHGYAIARELRDGDEARRLTAHGTLYRALERLEQRGLLTSRLEDPAAAEAERRPRRRLYRVTAQGAGASASATAGAQRAQLQARPGGAAS